MANPPSGLAALYDCSISFTVCSHLFRRRYARRWRGRGRSGRCVTVAGPVSVWFVFCPTLGAPTRLWNFTGKRAEGFLTHLHDCLPLGVCREVEVALVPAHAHPLSHTPSLSSLRTGTSLSAHLLLPDSAVSQGVGEISLVCPAVIINARLNIKSVPRKGGILDIGEQQMNHAFSEPMLRSEFRGFFALPPPFFWKGKENLAVTE